MHRGEKVRKKGLHLADEGECSQTGWSIILTWGMTGYVVPVLEKIPTYLTWQYMAKMLVARKHLRQ